MLLKHFYFLAIVYSFESSSLMFYDSGLIITHSPTFNVFVLNLESLKGKASSHSFSVDQKTGSQGNIIDLKCFCLSFLFPHQSKLTQGTPERPQVLLIAFCTFALARRTS
jgi:hypothetical protein